MKSFFMIFILVTLHLIFIKAQSTVQPIASEIFSKIPNVRDFTISSKNNEAYFTAKSFQGEISVILKMEKADEIWSKPAIAVFSGEYNDLEPFLSIDNLRLYFASNRPLSNTDSNTKDFDIWFVERKDINAEWSEPINIGEPINTSFNEFFPSVSINNNLYFTCDYDSEIKKDDIFFSEWKDGHYSKPISLSDSINTDGYEFNSFIAPDESFIIFSGYEREDGFGSGDLYISYRSDDGTWSKSLNLGSKINSAKLDYCPFVEMNSRILYFTSSRSSVNNNAFSNFDDLIQEINKYENGQSRIYKISFDEFLPMR